MKMNGEEVLLWLMNTIREQSTLTLKDEPIEFIPRGSRYTGHYPWQHMPRVEKQEQGIQKLAELGAIRLAGESHHPFRLTIVQPRFDELYKQFGGKASPQTTPAKHDLGLQCGHLTLNLQQATLTYKNNQPLDISPDTKAVKLLSLLLSRQELVEYVEIAKELYLNCYHEGVTNKDVRREVQFVRRDLAGLLAKSGMTAEEISQLIVSKKNQGYVVRCAPH